MPTTHCIECDEVIEVEGRPRIGQRIVCASCGADLEVVGVDPFEVDWAEEDEAEVWDDELEALDEEDIDDLQEDLGGTAVKTGAVPAVEEEFEEVEFEEDDLEEDDLEEDDLEEDDLEEDEFEEDEDEELDFDDDDYGYDDDYDDDERWS